jgi:apolipoprotein N-acyltransferase
MTLIILMAAFMVVHMRFHRPLHNPTIIPVNTDFGGPSMDAMNLDSQARELAVQKLILAHPNSLVLLPESVLPGWSAIYEHRWSKVFSELEQRHTGVLIGTTMPVPNTEANRNVMLSRGFTEHLSYVQRIPVPVGMWKIGDQHHGFPLMLRFPATIRVWDRRVGVLVCYEQFLVWPALQTLARNPALLFAPSNLYWAQGTRIPEIEHVSAQDWADLWGIPLYEASNR